MLRMLPLKDFESHICILRQSYPGVNNHFELIWFGKFRTPTLRVFVRWWDDEIDFGENEDAYSKESSLKISEKGNTQSWFLDLLFWLRGSSAFQEK